MLCSSSSPLQAALWYAHEYGWPVFPLIGKRPLTRHGYVDATCDEWQIRAWWRRFPQANIGVPTGQQIGLIVLDIDWPEGFPSLDWLSTDVGTLPPTLTARTGGGGLHLYFQHPGNMVIKNAVNLNGHVGIDVRGDGGYIVLPPSRHPRTGHGYTWLEEETPARLPRSLLARLVPPLPVPGSACTSPSLRLCQQGPGHSMTEWLALALERARLGNRNHTGYWLACRLRDLLLPYSEAEVVMREYAFHVPEGDHPYSECEALASLASAYRSSPARALAH